MAASITIPLIIERGDGNRSPARNFGDRLIRPLGSGTPSALPTTFGPGRLPASMSGGFIAGWSVPRCLLRLCFEDPPGGGPTLSFAPRFGDFTSASPTSTVVRPV